MNIADDTDSIRKRMEEIQQERVKQIMGVPIEEPVAEVGEAAIGWPYGAAAPEEPVHVCPYAGWKIYGDWWTKPEHEWQISEITKV